MNLPAAPSLQAKLLRLTVAAVAVALLVTGGLVALYEFSTFRPRVLEEVRVHANLMADTAVPALETGDARIAERLLGVLRHEPTIEAAAIYDRAGRRVAAYRRDAAATEPPAANPERIDRLADGKITICSNIKSRGIEFGRVWLQADLPGWGTQIQRHLWLMLVVALAVLVLGIAISASVRRQITDPLLALAQTVRTIGRQRDLGLRVDEAGGGEIGDLARSFNEMLAAVGERDRLLQAREARLTRQNAGLAELARTDLADQSGFDAALRAMTVLVAEGQRVERASIWFYNDDRTALVCADLFERGLGRHTSGQALTAADYPRYFEALAADRVIDAGDAAVDPRTAEFRDNYMVPLGITGMLDAPIRWRGRVTGVLCLEHVGPPRTWYADETAFAAALADRIALFLERREAWRAEAALRESEERYRNLINEARDAIFTLSVDGEILALNSAVETITGWRPSLWIGRNFTDPLRPEDREIARARFREVLQGGRPPSFELQIRSRHGSLVTLEFAVSPRMHEGRVIGLLGVGRDVTERRLAGEAQSKLEAQLQQAQKMEAIGNLAGGVAHDFNNILTAIIGHTQLAEMELPRNHPARESLAYTLAASQRAKELVQQILTFSRRQEFKREPARLEAIVRDALKLLRPVLPSSIEIRASIPDGLPPILADTTQVHQIVVNLATNSAHAMEEQGGRLEILLDEATVDDEMVSQKPQLRKGRFVRLWVTDTGCGMDEKTRERLFEPFFTTKEPGKGTGLGLAVVHGIVEQHEGAIVVYSAPGKGTSFQIYFPVDQSAPAAAAAAVSPDRRRGAGQCVMFVDDEDLILSVAEKVLTRAGYRAAKFLDPTEALAAFRENPAGFDLVITDLTMPRIKGTRLAAEMRELRPNLPIILATGFGGGLDSRGVQAMGLFGPLQKPFTNEGLLDAVAQALELGRPRMG